MHCLLDTKLGLHLLLGAPPPQNTQGTHCCQRPPTLLSSFGRLCLSRLVRIAVHLPYGSISSALVISEGNVSAGSLVVCGLQVALKRWHGVGPADGGAGGVRK
jgi:hypothetical protein